MNFTEGQILTLAPDEPSKKSGKELANPSKWVTRGAADYTICYYDKRIQSTHAHWLAMAAVCYSPLQTIFWYDITTTRRAGDNWFVGTMTNTEARTLKLALGFLPKGKKYTAKIYSDDPAVPTATRTKSGSKKSVCINRAERFTVTFRRSYYLAEPVN